MFNSKSNERSESGRTAGFQTVRAAFGIVPSAELVLNKGEFLRSLPYVLASTVLVIVAREIGAGIRDDTLTGHVVATGVTLLIILAGALLTYRVIWSRPGVRHSLWVFMPGILVMVELDGSTVSAIMLKMAVMLAISIPIALLAYRLADGTWLPPRWRR